MPPDAISAFLSAGPLGAVIIALGIALQRLNAQLKEAQDARVDDAKKVTKTLLELNDKWNATVTELATAVRELRARR